MLTFGHTKDKVGSGPSVEPGVRLKVLAAILITAVLLRLPLVNQSLWFDELWSTKVKLGSIFELIKVALADVHPPLYPVFAFLWVRVFGDSEVAVRIPPLLFGIASITLTYALARRFLNDRIALVTAFLLAVSPVHMWYSTEARQYSAALFFALLTLYAYEKLRDASAGGWWTGIYALSVAASLFTHFYLVFYVTLISCFAFLNGHPRRVRILSINAAAGFLFLCFLVGKIGTVGLKTAAGHLRSFSPAEFWQLFFNWFLLGNVFPPPIPAAFDPRVVVQIAAFALFALGVAVALRVSKGRGGIELLSYVFALPVILLLMSAAGMRQIYIERSLYILLPFFCMLLAAGLTAFSGWRRIALLALFTVFSGLVVSEFYARLDSHWTVYKPREDWRSASKILSAELDRSGGNLLIYAATPVEVLSYYDPRFYEALDDASHRRSGGAASNLGFVAKLRDWFERRLEAADAPLRSFKNGEIYYLRANTAGRIRARVFESGSDGFFLIRDEYWLGHFDRAYGEVLKDAGFQLVSQREVRGLKILRYKVGQPASSSPVL